MKAILSTGWGKLHFHETARALANAGVQVDFLTGWVPGPKESAVADFLGRLVGERNLAKRLSARDINLPGVRVLSATWAEVAGTLIAMLPRVHLLPLDLAYGLEFRTAAWASRKYLRDADVLLVRSGAGQSGAIQTARKNGLAVVTDQSLAHPAFIHAALREEFERFGLKVGYNPRADLWKLVLRDCLQADLLLVNSDFVRQTFVAFGYPEEKIRVAYLGVHKMFFKLKTDYSIAGPTKILFTGNFDVRKGVRILMESIRICRSAGHDIRLRLIGNLGNGSPCLLPSDRDFFTHVPFVTQEKLVEAFAGADLFAFPTFAEGSSRSGMEAAAAGLPIITTSHCGLPLQDGVSACFVPLGNAQSLADAIGNLASNRALRETLGRNAMTTIAGGYTWRHYGERVATILEEAKQRFAVGS